MAEKERLPWIIDLSSGPVAINAHTATCHLIKYSIPLKCLEAGLLTGAVRDRCICEFLFGLTKND